MVDSSKLNALNNLGKGRCPKQFFSDNTVELLLTVYLFKYLLFYIFFNNYVHERP